MHAEKTTVESNYKGYLKTFARGESDCTLRLGLSSLIKKTFQATGSKLCFYTSLKC